ncbi:uncharacterized protein PAN0_007d3268 [Moesziomyces antarcticus]|uniref:Uncharacterized protein n=1 Tax=Pseudozyma antarctica TaxID=84753 RepID=A0A081CEF5_PSEA2|nr:uncharacterized protein PAN0_007d3268 [Moesziomyces antarcticus]GAK65051.1 hypothetical protein PAN0_007d3268 [Moesziomyces antarcticus]
MATFISAVTCIILRWSHNCHDQSGWLDMKLARKISRATILMRGVGRSVASSHIGKMSPPSSGIVKSDPLVEKKSSFYCMMLRERRRRIRRANMDARRKAHEFSRAHFAAEMDLHSTRERSIGSRYIRRAAAAQPGGECEQAAFSLNPNGKTTPMQLRQGYAGQGPRSSPLQDHAPL